MFFTGLFHESIYKLSFKYFFWLVAIVLATKYTAGAASVAIVLFGAWCAKTQRPAYALICYCLLPFMVIMNPLVFGFGSLLSWSARLGVPFMAIAMHVASTSRPMRQTLPLNMMLLYITVAFISSIFGYAPIISFLKLINFTLFLYGIYWGINNLDQRIEDMLILRAFFFAFAVFVIVGSLVLNVVNPFAAHYSSYGWQMAIHGIEGAKDAMAQQLVSTGETGYFCGILNHSQCLGPTTACIAGWLLSDMLFVEKRLMRGHLILFALCPIILYMSYSRTSLLAFVVSVGVISRYCVPRFQVPPLVTRRLRMIMTRGLLVLVLGGVIVEVAKSGMTKWVMKGSSKSEREGKIMTAGLFSSRMGLIEQSLQDFSRSPVLGMGFQVSDAHIALENSGRFVLSAPIEKGFILTMILGETGVVGALAFAIFLFVFYRECMRKGYWVTLALFTTMLASNLGEATFFSPGGTGGPQWLYSLVGGFVIDITCLIKNTSSNTEHDNIHLVKSNL